MPGISSYLPFSSNSSVALRDHEQRALNQANNDDGDRSAPTGNEELLEIDEYTGPGDTLSSLMMDNIADEALAQRIAISLAAMIQRHKKLPFDSNTALNAGNRYAINLDPEGRFLKATFEEGPANVFHVTRDATGLRAWKEEAVLDFKVEALVFRMRGTLEDSVRSAGEGKELATKLNAVFKWDIDFRSDAVRGDTCKLLFERKYADDRPSGYGEILCAIYEGKKVGPHGIPGTKSAIRFGGKYYDERGEEVVKDFLKSPLGSRTLKVTSPYGNRVHPIDRVWRRHDGVDYGAPQGTPVSSIANGTVIFSGWQNGYGNYVCIRHDNGYESRYGHLHKHFVQVGQRLKQGQKIGLVGMTGRATGPHLDFQLLANGKHKNPQNFAMVQNPRRLAEPLKLRFSTVSDEQFSTLKYMVVVNSPERSRKSAID